MGDCFWLILKQRLMSILDIPEIARYQVIWSLCSSVPALRFKASLSCLPSFFSSLPADRSSSPNSARSPKRVSSTRLPCTSCKKPSKEQFSRTWAFITCCWSPVSAHLLSPCGKNNAMPVYLCNMIDVFCEHMACIGHVFMGEFLTCNGNPPGPPVLLCPVVRGPQNKQAALRSSSFP